MQNNISTNSASGIQTDFIKPQNTGIVMGKKSSSNAAYYAKKGEPMYLKEMDTDEDGVVSFEEFKDYCDEQGISIEQRIKMTQLASSYRIMQAQKKAEASIKKEDKKEETSENNDMVYAKRGDSNYDEIMDVNNDDKITYKEYLEYCKEHSKTSEEKADTKIEETESGEFKTSSVNKAVNAYNQQESQVPEGKIDDLG